jgi:hypothetical protein
MIERIAWAAPRPAIVEAALLVETGLRALRRINPEYTNMQATKSDRVVVHGYRGPMMSTREGDGKTAGGECLVSTQRFVGAKTR